MYDQVPAGSLLLTLGAGDIGRRHSQHIDLFENTQLFDLVLQVADMNGPCLGSPVEREEPLSPAVQKAVGVSHDLRLEDS